MKKLFDDVSYICSRQVTQSYSTSFYWAVKMLSSKIRDDIHAIYGFVRFADEIVDTFHDQNKELLLHEFETDLEHALERKISLNPILHSFQKTVHKYNIDRDLIDAFIKSMRADLTKQVYSNTADYEEYIYGSADVVGLMCLKIFVNGDENSYQELKESAKSLGSAFQKVNFLRDLKDDSDELNRSYFPHLAQTNLDEASKKIIIKEIQEDFDKAYIGIQKLPIEAKFGVYTAYVFYNKLLNKLIKTDAAQIRIKRVRISNPMKFYLLLKSFFNYRFKLI